MLQISLYQTNEDLKDKTIFTLIEKCYLSDSRVLVLMPDLDTLESVDKLLWTFSQKKFIPHSSNNDEFVSKQPIYLACNLENLNNSKILIIIGRSNIDFDDKQLEAFEKILIICDQAAHIEHYNQIFLAALNNAKISTNHYIQNDKGGWMITKGHS